MRTRYPGYASYSFGPGPVTPAVRALIIVNVVGFLLSKVVAGLPYWLGLVPALVFDRFWIWQLVTYMFLHGDLFHLLFNMLVLWMFGVDLERQWGTRFFMRYYFISGIGAAGVTLLASALVSAFVSEASSPAFVDIAESLRGLPTIGASGAIYGLLAAFALMYPHRQIVVFLLFPLPARIAVLLFGAISLYLSLSAPLNGVAHATHLGGLVVGYLYLAGRRGHLVSTVKSQWLRWRLSRLRKRFDVHEGGRKGRGGPWVH